MFCGDECRKETHHTVDRFQNVWCFRVHTISIYIYIDVRSIYHFPLSYWVTVTPHFDISPFLAELQNKPFK